MLALKEFANFISLNLANLATTYDRLSIENNERYHYLSPDNRIAYARSLIKAVAAAASEGGTPAPLIELVCRPLNQSSSFDQNRLSQALSEIEYLGQTLTPVATNLEVGKFLWQTLSEVRGSLLASLGKTSISKEEQRQRQLADSWREVATILNSSLDRETMLTRIMAQLQQVVNCDSDAIFLAAEQLRQAENKYGILVEQLPAAVHISRLDETGSSIYMSPQIEAISGYTPAEWLADPELWPRLIHPDDRERVLITNNNANVSGQAISMEYRLIAKDGREVWVREETHIIRAETGQPLFQQGIFFDITKHKQTEQALMEQARRLAALSDIGSALALTRSLDDILAVITSKARQIVAGDRVMVTLLNSAGDRFEYYALQGDGKQVGDLPVAATLVGDVVRAERIIITPDLRAVDHRVDAQGLLEQGFHSAIAAPLRVSGRSIGTLNLVSKTPGAYGSTDEPLLAQLAALLVAALENQRLFTQTELTLAESDTLYQATAALTQAQSYADILSILRQHTILGQGAQNVSLNYFDRPWTDNQRPEWINVPARWSELPSEAVSPRYPTAAFPSITQVLKADTLTFFADVATDPRLDDQARALYVQRFGAKSTIFVPLVTGGQWIGFINAIYQQPISLAESESRRLMTLVGQAAAAVQSVARLDDTERRAWREQTIREMTDKIRRAPNLEQLAKVATQELARYLDATHAQLKLGLDHSLRDEQGTEYPNGKK
jgi:PAS domain S-box-containing protein